VESIPPAPAWIVLAIALLVAGAAIVVLGVQSARGDDALRIVRVGGLLAAVAGIAVLLTGLETDADVAAWLLIVAGAIGGAVSARAT
jgi:hypothetical protein